MRVEVADVLLGEMRVVRADIAGDPQALGLRGTHQLDRLGAREPAQVHARAGGAHQPQDGHDGDGLGERRDAREAEARGDLAVVRDAVASFGRRPTFDNGAPLLEVFVFDFSGDLYGRDLEVTLHHFLRPEKKFASLDALLAEADSAAMPWAWKSCRRAWPKAGGWSRWDRCCLPRS